MEQTILEQFESIDNLTDIDKEKKTEMYSNIIKKCSEDRPWLRKSAHGEIKLTDITEKLFHRYRTWRKFFPIKRDEESNPLLEELGMDDSFYMWDYFRDCDRSLPEKLAGSDGMYYWMRDRLSNPLVLSVALGGAAALLFHYTGVNPEKDLIPATAAFFGIGFVWGLTGAVKKSTLMKWTMNSARYLQNKIEKYSPFLANPQLQ